MSGDSAGLGDALEEVRRRSAAALAFYDDCKNRNKLNSHRVLTYFCAKRCRLLDVLTTPSGLVAYWPRYKLSASVNEAETAPSARAERTEDGHRRWAARACFADDALNFGVTCDHLRTLVVTHEDIATDIEAGNKVVLLPRPAT